jgi:hypothetical protein
MNGAKTGTPPTTEPAAAPAGEPAPALLQAQARALVLAWIRHRQGSAAELLEHLEQALGWPARLCLPEILAALRASRAEPELDRKYLLYTLSEAAVQEALAGADRPPAEHQSSLDELFGRSRRFRRTRQFAEAVEFIGKFREYSPFNNMLVFLQNPLTTYFATAGHWQKAFHRTIKEEARGMIILAPRTPVLLVYDVAETEGAPLPEKLESFTRTAGVFDPAILDRTVKNCERDAIQVERQPMGRLRGGFSTWRVRGPQWKMRIGLRDALNPADAYAVLCHELAHIYLGHLGADKSAGWPYRLNLRHNVAEIEAESVAHIVCRRAGLRTHSAEYLSSFVEDGEDLDSISIDLVSRAAGRIEEMGRRLLPPRDRRA